ncbi:MAG: response regulator, partial [Proteobacteria bacterium]|nr:response regulator [Pseudomonadota bacterium]
VQELEDREAKRKHSEPALRDGERKYQFLFKEMLSGFARNEIICDRRGTPRDYRFVEANHAFERITGLKSEDIVGRTAKEIMPDVELQWIQHFGKVALTGEPFHMTEYDKIMQRYLEVFAYSPQKGQFSVILKDLTESKREEEARMELGEQLRQSRKVEAIGRLAGGVAHDFNNLLSPIIGYSEMALLDVEATSALHGDLEQILDAANRARELTHQLLAFGRKQVLTMRVLNLNQELSLVGKMLRRLIREDIDIISRLDSDLGSIKADPSQIQQILLNLAANANDAMSNGGMLNIVTTNATLDAHYADTHPGAKPGSYVMIAVSDNGVGMDDETVEHIFEPFFSTKRKKAASGLGMATVYGIVKQHNGYIWAESTPGKGTTFSLFFPRIDQGADTVRPSALQPSKSVERKTILVVEDERAVRKLAATVLQKNGYNVLEAADPGQAVRIAGEHGARIDLLLTDVIMPDMNGRELHSKIVHLRPQIKVIFMSGYTDDVIAHHGVLDEGLHFLQKPFSIRALATTVGSVLDAQR